MKGKTCSCESCTNGDFRLHIGDRIVFSGGIPGRLMHSAKALGEEAGLRFQGIVSKDTILVVTNDTADNSKTVQRAQDLGVKVASLKQFSIQIMKMINNGRLIFPGTNVDFNSLPLMGMKVYPVELTESELLKLTGVLNMRGAELAQQIRPSVAACVHNSRSTTSGACKIFASEGVPSFDIANI